LRPEMLFCGRAAAVVIEVRPSSVNLAGDIDGGARR